MGRWRFIKQSGAACCFLTAGLLSHKNLRHFFNPSQQLKMDLNDSSSSPIRLPHQNGTQFYNPWDSAKGSTSANFFKFFYLLRDFDTKRSEVTPTVRQKLELATPDLEKINNPGENDIQATWIGHASFLVQFEGTNILTDPIFSDRCSPIFFLGPKRIQPPAIPLEKLPPIHAVIISHNHYDHLDINTVKALGNNVTWFVPLGIKQWLNDTGIDNVHQLDWGESANFRDIEFVCTPCQHFSGRGVSDRNQTLWASWSVIGKKKRFYFAGDTGYRTVPYNFDESKSNRYDLPHCPAFKQIGDLYGPFDLAFIPIGAYSPRWFMSPVHADPTDAVDIHIDVRSRQSIGMHWGTFVLTDEAVLDPPNELANALKRKDLHPDEFIVLRHGQTFTLPSSSSESN